MKWISDAAVGRLRDAAEWPDLSGTRYEALELIGRGGMGAVFRARDTLLERDVAIKVVRFPDESLPLSRRILLEARVLARLEHPGIVPVHDFGELPDGRCYYVMKLVQGQRLDEFATGADLMDRLRVFGRICEAVAFAHSMDVVHRDLKPQNVMVGNFGEVLVLDWGVAKILPEIEPALPSSSGGDRTASDTAAGTVLGTPGYMPPEQASGESVDARSDVYALGAVLSGLLADGGRIPPPLRSICAKAMATCAPARYADAGELGADVTRFMRGDRVAAHKESMVEKAVRLARKHKTAVVLVLAYLIVRALVLFFGGR